jgi:GAF domain-containing protein
MGVMIMQKNQTEEELLSIISSFCNDKIPSFIHLNGIFANISSYLFHALEDINWVGFYYRGKDGSLVLGPFQGEVACMILSKGKGVCQKAALEKTPIIVNDVHLFPTHIACDSKSRSEAVFPIIVRDNVIAVLDIDSPHKEHFSPQLVEVLEKMSGIITTLFYENEDCLDII